MKKQMKRFVLSLSVMIIILGTVSFAAEVQQQIKVVFNKVNIAVNGKKVNTDNILYNGTTYVPLRAVSEILGKEVGWDEKTNTASINDKTGETPATEEPTKEPTKEPVKSSGETLSQKNAVKKGENYLNYSAFSKSGLIEQLKFEKFSEEDAIYAVNKINADWKEQATNKAKSYLEYSSFSRSGLIKQLEFEGFSNEEATYAVDQIEL